MFTKKPTDSKAGHSTESKKCDGTEQNGTKVEVRRKRAENEVGGTLSCRGS